MDTPSPSPAPVTWQWVPFGALRLPELYAALRLRQEVFVVEQTCPYLDADGADPSCHHLLGWAPGDGDDDDVLLAYLRVFPPDTVRAGEAVIGRVVTSGAVRRQGLGRALMVEGHRRVRSAWGAVPVWLSAQTYLRDFYTSLGYAQVGPGYLEDDIPHIPMRRAASP